ncbi:hypothetical protein C5167_033289 [Papaver somniferum]|uniref:Uncharacterized protein n=1 Tax=Papaver somniferum TaxID=3469 RepID=A0A4Y7KB96_PAPSO|nr:hypothetical protein C5167_033289 [Papaver somniferum]
MQEQLQVMGAAGMEELNEKLGISVEKRELKEKCCCCTKSRKMEKRADNIDSDKEWKKPIQGSYRLGEVAAVSYRKYEAQIAVTMKLELRLRSDNAGGDNGYDGAVPAGMVRLHWLGNE